MRRFPRSSPVAFVLLLPLALSACDEPTPDPRPGEALATGLIQGFSWMGDSAGLAYTIADHQWGIAVRVVELSTGADREVGSLDWGIAPPTSAGGAAAVYLTETSTTGPEPVTRILRVSLAGERDTVASGLRGVVRGLAISPDERRLAYLGTDSAVVLDLDTGARWTWEANVEFASLSPDGERLLLMRPWDADGVSLLEVGGGSIPLATSVGIGYGLYGFAPPIRWQDGHPLLLLLDADRTLVEQDLLSGDATTLSRLPDDALGGEVGWSRDGERVAFPTSECTDSDARLFSFEPECVEYAVRLVSRSRGGDDEVVALLLTELPLYGGYQPSFSPDGSRLAYLAPGTRGERTLYVVDLR